jgi:hypothetical protein
MLANTLQIGGLIAVAVGAGLIFIPAGIILGWSRCHCLWLGFGA